MVCWVEKRGKHHGRKASVIRTASSMDASSSWLNVSILDRNRDLSKDRIWSPNTRAGLPSTTTMASPGYSESTWLVSGNTTTREPNVLQELLEMITTGLVFLISDPTVGSSATQVDIVSTGQLSYSGHPSTSVLFQPSSSWFRQRSFRAAR